MPESNFELLLHDIDANTDTYELANILSKLLDSDARYLEKQFVKVKFSDGRSETIKVGLTKLKALRYQKVFTNLGLKTSVQEKLALVPIEKKVMKDRFVCPACHTKQEIDEGKIKICSKCGIVKEKYDEIQKRKKLVAEKEKHEKVLERQARIRPKESIEEKNEAFLRKKYGNPEKKKNPTALLLSALLGVVMLSGAGYVYLTMNGVTDTDETANLGNNNKVANADPIQQTTSVKTSQGGRMAMDQTSQLSVSASSASSTSAGVDLTEELGNPYSHLADSSAPKMSMQKGIKHINTLLKKNNKQLSKSDDVILDDIIAACEDSEGAEKKQPDYKRVKQMARTIHDENVRNEVVRQASWEELTNKLKTFKDFGVAPSIREGEEASSVKLATRLMKLYIRDYKFNKAAEMVSQIDDLYLKAVAYNRIIDKQVYLDKDGAKIQRDKIYVISRMDSLSIAQKTLVLGILGRVDGVLESQEKAQASIKQAQFFVNTIQDPEVKIATLIQLSEDQREGLNLTLAHHLLEEAYTFIEHGKVGYAIDKNKVYSALAKQYAKLLEFKKSRALIEKITDTDERMRLAQIVASIEKQTNL